VKKCEEGFKKRQEVKQFLLTSKQFKDHFFDSEIKKRHQTYEGQILEFKKNIEKEYKKKILEMAVLRMKEDIINKQKEA
jgi:hypothetical protein